MNFNLHTHETLVLLAGILGLMEQEAARLFFSLDPSSVLSGIFGSMVLGSIGVGVIRNATQRNGRHGNGKEE